MMHRTRSYFPSLAVIAGLTAATRLLSFSTAGTDLSITTASTLPAAVTGQAYSTSLAATGGTPPYQWVVGQGIPGTLTLSSTGTISGTPAATGTYSFAVQVTDANQGAATKTFSLTVNTVPLSIATVAPLFSGTAGTTYAQVFSATGGVSPYRWSILSGDTGGLTLDTSSGTLQGTPQTVGTFTFTIQVSDSAGGSASQTFSVVVAAPSLTITTAATLTSGTVDVSYSQKFAVVGGTQPYEWTLISGSVPGLTFDPQLAVLTGTPLGAGTFTVVLQAKDAAGLTVTKTFTLAIAAAALRIASGLQLPDGSLASAYSAQLAATGGVTPYTWSANGLPDGLALDSATGLVTGKPTVTGAISFTIRVTDSNRTTTVELFHINITLPAVPAVQFTGLSTTVDPAQQLTLKIALASSFPAAITGQAILSFSPDVGGNDATIQFSSGGRTAGFTIPAGSTSTSGDGIAIQTGTAAGVITVTLRLVAGGQDITPSPAPTIATSIARAAPVIRSATVTRNSSGFDIEIAGYSTAREATQAVFTFSAKAGQTLQASSVTVQLESVFNAWFLDSANSRYGSQFTFTQPFTIQGDATAVTPDSVTLTNRQGSVTAAISQ
jgi:large repetitive protein